MGREDLVKVGLVFWVHRHWLESYRRGMMLGEVHQWITLVVAPVCSVSNCFQRVVFVECKAWYAEVALRMRESSRCTKRKASVV